MTEDSKMKRANALRSSAAAGVLLRVAALGLAGAVGTVVPASAAFYYPPDSGYYSEQQIVQPQRRQQPQRARRGAAKKETVVKDTTVHPQLPLVINVSIAKQRVRVYDANGFFAESPVSTGMPGHATPTGVFSVIQKDRFHHSNIYSGAPMPFMQRITWEGVALHAGVLPGYPASHGCIRMPEAFAVKMWGWTKMGARVIVTPGEVPAPENFEHPLLPAMKVVPQPAVAQQPETNEPLAAKADKGEFDMKPIQASLELRSTVGHSDPAKPQDQAAASDTRTADASSSVPVSAVANAAASNHANDAATAKADESKPESAKPDAASADKPVDAKPDAATADAVKPANGDDSAAAKPAETADASKPDDKPASADKPADAAAASDAHSAPKPNQTEAVAKPTEDAAKPATNTAAEAKPVEAKADAPAPVAKPDTASAAPAKPETAKPDQAKPADPVKAADAVPPAAKDQTRVQDPIKPAAKPEKKREGQIAVFISRKDSKIYVRQNFAPLFQSPVTIAPSDRPLGTHVFTAEVDKNDSNLLHWSVVNVPMSARAAMGDDEPRVSRRKKGKPEPVAEVKAGPVPDSPSEALDRITIPPDVMARISEALSTGGSIVVSDQGISQGDTGEGTDFILSLR
jgi:lipoprotein-anchoring transpeptidase ErfK/SrfK